MLAEQAAQMRKMTMKLYLHWNVTENRNSVYAEFYQRQKCALNRL